MKKGEKNVSPFPSKGHRALEVFIGHQALEPSIAHQVGVFLHLFPSIFF
jgi:hypothetical protein